MSGLVYRNRSAITRLQTVSNSRTKATISLTASKPRVPRPQKIWRLRKQEQHVGDSSRRTPRRRQKATLATEVSPPPAQRKRLRQSLEEFLRKPRTVPIPRWITPSHSSFTVAELFGHSSFVLVAAAYAVDDFLQLRMISVVGSTAMLVFTYFHPHGRVLWLPFKWNCLFIAINSYRIGKVYWNRYRASRLSPELLDLYRKNFYLMDEIDFARLVSAAKVEEFRDGEVLVRQGEMNGCVRLVVDGECQVIRDGKLTYILESANFVSEAGLHAGLLLPGEMESCCTVVSASPKARLLTWNRTELVELMQLYPGLMRSFKATLSWDVIRKLKAQRSLLASGTVADAEEWTARRLRQTNDRYAAILHNLLTSEPHVFAQRRKELDKYRMIHHIDEEHHVAALRQVGWTPEEFEARRKYQDDNMLAPRDLKWYVSMFYHRIFA